MSDPKKIVLVTPGVSGLPYQDSTRLTFPDSTFLEPIRSLLPDFTQPIDILSNMRSFTDSLFAAAPEKSAAELLTDKVKEQYQQNGTLKELVLSAHGTPGTLHIGNGETVSMKEFLGGLDRLQADLKNEARRTMRDPGKVKLADRIVFAGCDTMAGFHEREISDYSQLARSLGADVVGTETIGWDGTGDMKASWIRFGRDGSISKDPVLHDADDKTLAADLSQYNLRNAEIKIAPISEIEGNKIESWIGTPQEVSDGISASRLEHALKKTVLKLEAFPLTATAAGARIESEMVQLEGRIPEQGRSLPATDAQGAKALEKDLLSRIRDYVAAPENTLPKEAARDIRLDLQMESEVLSQWDASMRPASTPAKAEPGFTHTARKP